MSIFNVKSTGTRTSGISTPGDWSDANCWATANMTNCYGAMSDNDEMILNDEDHNLTSQINTTKISGSATIKITVKSRSGDPELCAIRGKIDGIRALLIRKNGTPTLSIDYQNIRFTHDNDLSSNEGMIFRVDGTNIGTIDFQNCIIGPFINTTATTHSSKLFESDANNMTIKFTQGTRFENITLSGTRSILWTIQTNTTAVFDSCVFSNIDLDIVGAGFGAFQFKGIGLIVNNCIFNNITIDGDGSNTIRGVWMHNWSSGRSSFTDNVVNNLTVGNATVQGAFIYFNGPHTVTGLTVNRLTIPNGGASLGGCVLAIYATASGSYMDWLIQDSSGVFGTVFYLSAGASAKATGIRAIDCKCQAGNIYLGGSGNVTVEGYLALNCVCSDSGAGIYSHNNSTVTPNNKVANLRNITIKGCTRYGVVVNPNTSGKDAGIWLAQPSSTNTIIHNLDNIAIDCPMLMYELWMNKAGTSAHTINLDYCAIDGKLAENGVIVNETNSINDLDLKINDDGTLRSDSPLVGAGKDARDSTTGPFITAANGEPIPPFAVDVGGVQSSYGAFHPLNL